MNAMLDESTSSRAEGQGTDDPSVRILRYPSIDFPVLPAIELAVPESWRPIGAAVINEMRIRPDVAVAGPEVVDGIRPNLMAKVSRLPVDGDIATVDPRHILEALFARQRTGEEAEAFEYRIHDAESDAQPYGMSRHTERLGDVDVQRLTCAVIVATGPVVHLVIVQAALSPTDLIGRSAIEAAFASLRISAPKASATTPGVEGG